MFNERKMPKALPAQRYVKKQVPFTVRELGSDPIVAKAAFNRWQEAANERSRFNTEMRTQKAMGAFLAPPKVVIIRLDTTKTPVFTRIYNYLLNLFLNINISY